MTRPRWARATAVVALATIAAALAGCSLRLSIPDEDDSRAVVTAAYQATLAGDDDALCALATSAFSCEQSLIGVPAAPTDPPIVTCTWEFRPGRLPAGPRPSRHGDRWERQRVRQRAADPSARGWPHLIDPVFWNDAALSQGDLDAPAVVPPC